MAPAKARATRLVRIREKGQVTIPASARKRLGLKEGDLVAVTETPDGVLISPQASVAIQALDEIGALLREHGITLEEMIESGREERGRLIEETYGIPLDQQGE